MCRGLSSLTDRVDEIPLAHLRAAGDALLLRDLVELRAVAILERVPRLAAAFPPSLRLLLQAAARTRGKMGDRPLLLRGPLRLLDVPLRRLCLLLRRHASRVPRDARAETQRRSATRTSSKYSPARRPVRRLTWRRRRSTSASPARSRISGYRSRRSLTTI